MPEGTFIGLEVRSGTSPGFARHWSLSKAQEGAASCYKPFSHLSKHVHAVNSVLAIGGVGGLAVGLAGREILENLFTGLIILSSSPFEVGDEVQFTPPNGPVSSAAPGIETWVYLHGLQF